MANLRTLNYQGFKAASSSLGTSGWMFWSGSKTLTGSGGAPDTTYDGIGLEAVLHSESYFRYSASSAGSGLDIRTNTFFLGSSDSFLSGSGDGTIALSSSNFELTADGAVTMQGSITATAGGTIGGWTIGSDYLYSGPMIIDSGDAFISSSAGDKWMISSSADATDPAGFISSSLFKVRSSGQVTASAVDISGKVTATSGEIAGWEIESDRIKKVSANGGITLYEPDPGIYVTSGSALNTEIVKIGNLGSNKFGIRGKDTSGNLIFKLGEDGNQIAGWTFDNAKLTSGPMMINATDAFISSSAGDKWMISSSADSTDEAGFISSSLFKVRSSGQLTASAANIEGKITAGSGEIGGWGIQSTYLANVNSDGGVKIDASGKVLTFRTGSNADTEIIEIGNLGSNQFGIKALDSEDSANTLFKLGEAGNEIAQWTITNTEIKSGSAISLDSSNKRITINDTTFGNTGIQLDYNSGTPRAFIGKGDGEHLKFDGSSLFMSSSEFYMGSDTQYISGAEGKIEISSSYFHLDNTGNVSMAGIITANEGEIGGWSIGGTTLTSGPMMINSANAFISSSAGDKWMISSSADSTDEAGFISSSLFKVRSSGQVTASSAKITGNITAQTGQIGGWDIQSTTLTSGPMMINSANAFISSSAGDKWMISSSNDSTDEAGFISSSLFKVRSSGQVTGSQVLFTGGKIGGWDIGDTYIESTNDKVQLKSDKYALQVNPGGTGTDTKYVMVGQTWKGSWTGNYGISAVDGNHDWLFRLDDAERSIAGWNFDNEKLQGGSMILKKDGTIESDGFASNVAGSGFRLTAASGGFLEVENARIRGTLSTAVFEKEAVNAVGGQLYVANSTVLTGSAFATTLQPSGYTSSNYPANETTMSVVNVTGFAVGEIITAKKVNSTGFATEYMKIESSSRFSGAENDLSGAIYVERGLGTSFTGASGSLGDSGSAAQPYSGSQVIVSTGKLGTGYIRLNANPNDPYTPYIDIVERTGSDVYDVDLKARLGDLSGITDSRFSDDVTGYGLYTQNGYFSGKLEVASLPVAPPSNNLIVHLPFDAKVLSGSGELVWPDFANGGVNHLGGNLHENGNYNTTYGADVIAVSASSVLGGNAKTDAGHNTDGKVQYSNCNFKETLTIAGWFKRNADDAGMFFAFDGDQPNINPATGATLPNGKSGAPGTSGPDLWLTGTNINWNTGNGNANPFCETMNGTNLVINDHFPIGTWKHFAVVNDFASLTCSLYIDGVKQGVAAYRNTTTTNDDFNIFGYRGTDVNHIPDGEMDEFRIYTGSLTTSEIEALYLSPNSSVGSTKIVGDQLTTGKILSNNWNSNNGSELDLDAGTIKLGGHLAPDFAVSAIGEVTASAGLIGGWEISSSFLSSSDGRFMINSDATGGSYRISSSGFQVNDIGAITSSKGTIADWTIDPGKLTSGPMMINSTDAFISSSAGDKWMISSSADSTDEAGFISSSLFKVRSSGQMTASAANIEGKITATSGEIGGWDVSSTLSKTNILLDPATPKITLGSKATLTDANTGLYLGTDGLALGASSVFKVTSAGAVNASDMTITGGSLSVGTGNDILKVDTDGDLWIGNATQGSAPFQVAKTGALIATSATISGDITVTGGQLTSSIMDFPSDDNLVAYYPLHNSVTSENGYDRVLDFSGYDRHGEDDAGSISGGTTFVSGAEAGPLWGAAKFDGSNSRIDINAAKAGLTNGMDISLSFWIYVGANSTDMYSFGFHDGSGNDLIWQMDQGGTNNKTKLHINSLTRGYVTSTLEFTNTWRHVVLSMANGANGKLYVDGIHMGDYTDELVDFSAIADVDEILLGGELDAAAGDPTNDFTGLMSEFRIYKTALTADNALALFNMPSGPNSGGTKISGDKITTGKIHSNNWSTTAGSQLDLDGGTIKLGGSSSPSFQVDDAGAVTSSAGTIGGWTIGSTLSATNILLDPATPKMTLGSKSTLTDSNTGLYMGTDGIALGASSVFKVTDAGALTATNATITGDITVTNGGDFADPNMAISSSTFYENFHEDLDNTKWTEREITQTLKSTTPEGAEYSGSMFNNSVATGHNSSIMCNKTFLRSEFPTLEFDVTVNADNPATWVGWITSSYVQADTMYQSMAHSVYLYGRDIHVYNGVSQQGGSGALGLDCWTNLEDTTFRIRMTLRQAGCYYEVYKNGDMTTPFSVYTDTSGTEQFVTPIIGIYSTSATEQVTFGQLSVGKPLQQTRISGNSISTGLLKSNNWPSAGSEYNLNAGTIRMGGDSSPVFEVSSTGAVTASAGTIGAWTLGNSTLTGGSMVIDSAGKISTSTDANTTRIIIDGSSDPAEISFYSASSEQFEFTTNIQILPYVALSKGSGTLQCQTAQDTGLSGIELKQTDSGIMGDLSSGKHQIQLFPGDVRVKGNNSTGIGTSTHTGHFVREFIGCTGAPDNNGVVSALKGEYQSDVNDSSTSYRCGVIGTSRMTNASADGQAVGGYFKADEVGSGTAYSVYGAEGIMYNAGEIQSAADIIAFASSDRRMKDNILEIENPIEKIKKIRGVTFNWNEKGPDWTKQNPKNQKPNPFATKRDVGVIAQEIQKVLPEVVHERTKESGHEGMLAVKYEKIVPLLIEGIKEQQNTIEELTERIKKLENK